MTEQVLRNARIVMRGEVVHGDLLMRDGEIAAVDSTGFGDIGTDLEGDFLLPGLVELHTDHLESHYAPRPGVRWNAMSAVQAHDAQIAASGITTVFDALRVGMDEDARISSQDMRLLADTIGAAEEAGRLRAEHFIHLRCEVSAPDAFDGFMLFEEDTRLRLASLMDHTPGQRQFTTLESYRVYYQGKTGMSDEDFEAFVGRRQEQAGRWSGNNRRQIADHCRAHDIVLASHDDATSDHVAEAAAQGVTLAEFPTTLEAAQASRDAGMKVLMGAPNVVRNGSHSGNISARALAARGLLDVLSSDYVPFSLVHAAFVLAEVVPGTLPEAVALVATKPAETAGLHDRGVIAPGKRADLVQIKTSEDVPVVRSVWRQGRRVA
jgi:alpha-D-ribose 1-methylphosphonate 5-triphosphate diphosphatase